jgi:hypothetical protein
MARSKKRVRASDLGVLETPTGREGVTGAAVPGTLLDAELREAHAAQFAQTEIAPSEVLVPHEPGDDSEAGEDGLNQLEESVRHLAEDVPSGDGEEDAPPETPVFDRRDAAPKL